MAGISTPRAKMVHQKTDASLEAAIRGAAHLDSTHQIDAFQPDTPEEYDQGLPEQLIWTIRAAGVMALRGCLLATHAASDSAQAGIRCLQPLIGSSTRAGFLRTLPELVGPPPQRHWKEEWTALTVDFLSDQPIGKDVAKLSEAEQEDWVESQPLYSIEGMRRDMEPFISTLVEERCWDARHAEAYALLYPLRAPLSRALASRQSTFAASTYALSEALAASAAVGEPLVRRVYKHLHGANGLVESDAAWAMLLVPDRTGFRGLTSSSLVVATRDPRCFTEQGFRNGTTDDDGQPLYEPMEGDVVCIENAPSDTTSVHAAVMINDLNGALPPNTLYRLKRVMAPGTWAVPGVRERAVKTSKSPMRSSARQGRPEMEECEVRPQVRLLVVSCTFRPPRDPNEDDGQRGGGKLCGTVQTLVYASREAYVAGLDDLLAQPTLSLTQEFVREMKWTDWRGDTFSLREEWAYVLGPAAPLRMRAGIRDEAHAGKHPADFLREVNAFIAARRRQAAKESSTAQPGYDATLLMLPEANAYLTLEEVLAVRLYSGPAFQPINEFLRQVGRLTGEYRLYLARQPRLTFAATVGLLCSAIRKLSAVTTLEEASEPLYRGVRGELPRAFWHEDKQGLITAVDLAFMSTSRNERTPIEYMDGAYNILWTLHPQAQSDAAYHRGADISMLSQFASEEEVLFPPCCMMIVQRPPLPPSRPYAPPAGPAISSTDEDEQFTVSFPPGPLGLAFKSKPPPPAPPRSVCVDDVVFGSPAHLQHVPIGAAVLAVDGKSMAGLSKAEVLREIGAQSGDRARAITFSGAPAVELHSSPYALGVPTQPLPPPPMVRQTSADPVDATRQLYEETLERDGKRFVKLHVLPCFV